MSEHVRFETEGRRLLREAGSIADITARTQLSRSMVAAYRSGAALPSARAQGVIEAAVGVPRSAWGWTPDATATVAPGATAPSPDAAHGNASPRAHLDTVRMWRLSLQKAGAPPKDVTAALEAERRAIELVGRAAPDHAEVLLECINEVLQGHPELQDALKAMLQERGL